MLINISIVRKAALSRRSLLLTTIGLPFMVLTMDPRACRAQAAQQAQLSSQTKKLEFEVASVRQNKTADKSFMNVSPTSGDYFVPTGGLYSARNIVLVSYIAFAYKLTNRQLQSAVSQVPWIAEERFDIEARAEGNPTKDQYRLMMQSLLEERFKLLVHIETRQAPIFALVLAKPGKPGPQLRMHDPDDPVCLKSSVVSGSEPTSNLSPEETDAFPQSCGANVRMKPSGSGRIKNGGRDVSLTLMASVLTGVGNIGRPMVDQTGLKGTVDYNLEWGMVAANVPNATEFHPDESAPTFVTALKEQLGIKLVPDKGPVEFFRIDHLEHPSPN